MTPRQRNAAIIDMARQGVRPRDLAAYFGTRVDWVYHILNRARRRGDDVPTFSVRGEVVSGSTRPGPQTRPVMITADAITALAPYAEQRSIGVAELAAKIIQIVADEDLVLAVLDDGIAERPFG